MEETSDGAYQHNEDGCFSRGPNSDDPNFYTNFNENIAKLKIPNLILADDWNLVLDPSITYCNYKRTKTPKRRWKKFSPTTVWWTFGENSTRSYNGLLGDEQTLFNKAG